MADKSSGRADCTDSTDAHNKASPSDVVFLPSAASPEVTESVALSTQIVPVGHATGTQSSETVDKSSGSAVSTDSTDAGIKSGPTQTAIGPLAPITTSSQVPGNIENEVDVQAILTIEPVHAPATTTDKSSGRADCTDSTDAHNKASPSDVMFLPSAASPEVTESVARSTQIVSVPHATGTHTHSSETVDNSGTTDSTDCNDTQNKCPSALTEFSNPSDSPSWSANIYEANVDIVLEVGGGKWDRELAFRALTASCNNTAMAIDLLYSGIFEKVGSSPPGLRSEGGASEAPGPSRQGWKLFDKASVILPTVPHERKTPRDYENKLKGHAKKAPLGWEAPKKQEAAVEPAAEASSSDDEAEVTRLLAKEQEAIRNKWLAIAVSPEKTQEDIQALRKVKRSLDFVSNVKSTGGVQQ